MVKVSICIPTYNQTDFLEKNLDSICAQSFRDFEVVVSDDSSDQRVEELVTRKLKNSGLAYTYHHNSVALGSPANWNKAVSMASGAYIKIMHHDDWFSTEKSLAAFVTAFDNHAQSDFVFCDSLILNVQENKYHTHQINPDFLKALPHDAMLLFNNNQIGSPTAVMYRANAVQFDEKLSYLVDVDFYLQCLQKNTRLAHVADALIVNTSNHAAQVTARSINQTTQIGEYCYLYQKWMGGHVPKKKWRVFFRDLFAWYGLKNFEEITTHGYPIPEPRWCFKLLLFQSRLKK
jgi:glycosyltransferase involved in cell wall biosynthesis